MYKLKHSNNQHLGRNKQQKNNQTDDQTKVLKQLTYTEWNKQIEEQTRVSSSKVLIKTDFLATSISTSKLLPSLDWRQTRTIFQILSFRSLFLSSHSVSPYVCYLFCRQGVDWDKYLGVSGSLVATWLAIFGEQNQNKSESQVFGFWGTWKENI